MAEETRVPLLEKLYHANCPGCKQDQIKESQRGIPFKEFLYISIVVLCSALPLSSLFPFLYFMIKDFHIAKGDQDIGFYAGYVGSAYMIGRSLTSIFWGVVADQYGRKPVILIGTISVVVFNTLFGLSTNFWMAISMRFFLGFFNGLLGTIKAYATEVSREEHQALALSLVKSFSLFAYHLYHLRGLLALLSFIACPFCLVIHLVDGSRERAAWQKPYLFDIVCTSWGIGLIIGPALGGFFAQPAENYPNIFSKNSLFGRFPYLLPCLCISFFAAAASIACCWIPETLHNHSDKIKGMHNSFDAVEASLNGSDLKASIEETKGRESTSNGSLLKNWPLMSSILVYCIFSLHDTAYIEIFSLWAVSDRKFGGLSFSSQDVGVVLAISGLCLLIFQLFLYPMVEKILGPIMVSRSAAILSIPLLSSFPFMAMLSGFSLTLLINCASALKNVLSVAVITGMFLLQNNAVSQHQRGAANGIAMTGMSLFNAIGPAGGGALFAWAQKRQNASFLPGDQMVFFTLNVVEFIGVILTFKPFLATPNT